MASPTARTLKYYRDKGYYIEVVERYNHYTKRRNDFAGFCDMIAIKGKETVCVQATTVGHIPDHQRKIEASPNLALLKSANWTVTLIGWKKYKLKRGGKAYRWREKIIDL